VSDLTGELIDGRYQLQRLIASGGMASIYVAMDVRLDRKVAVKIMHPHLASDEEFVNRFIREAKATAALSHPNIVSIQDQGWNENGSPAVFIVMEYIDGFTLREMLGERGTLPPLEVLQYMVPVTSALAEAHRLGIIHRDIKPENILLSKDGRIKIADFGLARGASLGSTMTVESSVVLGSVSYLSPEQVQRGISDARSDIYSLGIVLFELLTGKKPYDGETPIQIAYMHVNERIPAPSTLKATIPASLDSVIVKATSPNPDQRYSDASELLQALRDVQIELDPSKRQLTLELDLPPKPMKTPKSSGQSGKERFAKGFITGLSNSEEKPARKIINILSGENSLRTSGVQRKNDSSSLTKADQGTQATQKVPRMESSMGMKATGARETTAQLKRRTSRRVKRNRAIAALMVVALGGFGWYHFAGPGSQITVPSVVGMSEQEAQSALTPLFLKERVATQEYSEDVPKGKIISSDPAGGGHLNKNGLVLLTISKGAERIAVPSLVGLSVDAATAALTNLHLKVGSSTQSYDGTVPVGFISATDPVAGASVRPNSIVNLVISKGVQQLPLTSYVGKSADQASSELTSAGFSVNSSFGYSDTVAPGYVISQSPDGTTPAPAGTVVNLVVSQGPEKVYIPNIYSLTELQARTALENLQLTVVVKRLGTKKVKTVVNVSPKVGSQVNRGSAVTITVG